MFSQLVEKIAIVELKKVPPPELTR
jgi:hypothetical protein